MEPLIRVKLNGELDINQSLITSITESIKLGNSSTCIVTVIGDNLNTNEQILDEFLTITNSDHKKYKKNNHFQINDQIEQGILLSRTISRESQSTKKDKENFTIIFLNLARENFTDFEKDDYNKLVFAARVISKTILMASNSLYCEASESFCSFLENYKKTNGLSNIILKQDDRTFNEHGQAYMVKKNLKERKIDGNFKGFVEYLVTSLNSNFPQKIEHMDTTENAESVYLSSIGTEENKIQSGSSIICKEKVSEFSEIVTDCGPPYPKNLLLQGGNFEDIVKALANLNYTNAFEKIKQNSQSYESKDVLIHSFRILLRAELDDMEIYEMERLKIIEKTNNDQGTKEHCTLLKFGPLINSNFDNFIVQFENSDFLRNWEMNCEAFQDMKLKLRENFLNNVVEFKHVDYTPWDCAKNFTILVNQISTKNKIDKNDFKQNLESNPKFLEFFEYLKYADGFLKKFDEEMSIYLKSGKHWPFDESREIIESMKAVALSHLKPAKENEENIEILKEAVDIREKYYNRINHVNYENFQKISTQFVKLVVKNFDKEMLKIFPKNYLSSYGQIEKISSQLKNSSRQLFLKGLGFDENFQSMKEILNDLNCEFEQVIDRFQVKNDLAWRDFEKLLFSIELRAYKEAEKRAENLDVCAREAHFHFRREISQNTKFSCEHRILNISKYVRENWSKFEENYRKYLENNASAGSDDSRRVDITSITKPKEPMITEVKENLDQIDLCIEFGFFFIKAGYAKANGNSFLIIKLDKNSQEMPAILGFEKGQVFYGSEAYGKENTVRGKDLLSPDTQFVYPKIELNKLELITLFFKKVEQIVEKATNSKINNCVIVIPSFLGIALRSVVSIAAQFCSFSEVTLLDEHSSFGIYYEHARYDKINEHTLVIKAERNQLEVSLIEYKPGEIIIKEMTNLASLQNSQNICTRFNGLTDHSLSNEEISQLSNRLIDLTLKDFVSKIPLRGINNYTKFICSTDTAIKDIFIRNEEKFQCNSALLGGTIYSQNPTKFQIHPITPVNINLSLLDDQLARTVKKRRDPFITFPQNEPIRVYKKIFDDQSGTGGLVLKITEVLNNHKVQNLVHLDIELNDDQYLDLCPSFIIEGRLGFYKYNNCEKKHIHIKQSWIIDSKHLNQKLREDAAKKVEELFSGVNEKIEKEKQDLANLLKSSRKILETNENVSNLIKYELEKVFKEADSLLLREKPNLNALLEQREKIGKWIKRLT